MFSDEILDTSFPGESPVFGGTPGFGLPNTGEGGDGGTTTSGAANQGGSGQVVIRYKVTEV